MLNIELIKERKNNEIESRSLQITVTFFISIDYFENKWAFYLKF